MESGNGKGITDLEMETETEYGIWNLISMIENLKRISHYII